MRRCCHIIIHIYDIIYEYIKKINSVIEKGSVSFYDDAKNEDKEAKTIQEIVNRDEEMVLSLGGGAFVNQETRKILKQKTLIIWLHASIEETLKRVGTKTNRPLLNQKNKRQVLEDLAKIRYPIYREADFDFDTTHLTHEDLVEKIINKIKTFKNAQ